MPFLKIVISCTFLFVCLLQQLSRMYRHILQTKAKTDHSMFLFYIHYQRHTVPWSSNFFTKRIIDRWLIGHGCIMECQCEHLYHAFVGFCAVIMLHDKYALVSGKHHFDKHFINECRKTIVYVVFNCYCSFSFCSTYICTSSLSASLLANMIYYLTLPSTD